MSVNKCKGNMYGFVTGTWNTVTGRCKHACCYCFNLGMPYFEGELSFNEKNLNDDLGENNFIFVGSSNDLFQDAIPDEWILRTLKHCKRYNKNKYLFQTKNPKRFGDFIMSMPYHTADFILCTTIETNRDELISHYQSCPKPSERIEWMLCNKQLQTMVTIEPIIDFDLQIIVEWIKKLKPIQVNIGADSKGHKLPEPSKEKTLQLIEELKKITNVIIKPNLKRIINV